MGNKPILIPQDLQENISLLERRSLENYSPPYPDINRVDAAFFHVLTIGKEPEGSRRKTSTSNPVEELAVGLFGGQSQIAYMLLGELDKISVFYGGPSRPESASLSGILQASFPYVDMEGPMDSDTLVPLFELPYCSALTGIPAGRRNSLDGRSDHISRLIRGLWGGKWAFLVLARPYGLKEIEGAIESLSQKERFFASAYLREGTSERDNNPQARYYHELLSAEKDRFKKGRAQGMFSVEVYIFCPSQETLDRARVLLFSIFSGTNSKPQPLRFHQCLPRDSRQQQVSLATSLNSSELSLLLQPPLEEFPGLAISEHPKFEVALLDKHGERSVINLGEVLDRGFETHNWLRVAVDDLTKHAFISGTTGSGKTNTCFHILGQLWAEHRIPWLVIEPKEEYRSLLASKWGDIRVFTLGNERESPFRSNPLAPQPGVPVQAHISYLRSLFLSSFVLYPPMPYVLEIALQQIYEEKGWDTVTDTNPRGTGPGSFPTLTDLYYKVEELSGKLGYDPEVTMNIRAGLKARIQSLRVGAKGRMLDTHRSISMEELLTKPTILELGGLIGDPEEVAFMMGAILIALFEYRRAQGASTGLRHVTLLEEAHHLLTRLQETGGSGPETPNTRGKAIETFCNLLAEIRAYGEGLIVVDQIPSKLAVDVIKNTNLKVVHRTVAKDDRELVGACMNMSEEQKKRLATLPTGQAAVFGEGMEGPFLVSVPTSDELKVAQRKNATQAKDHMERHFFSRHVDMLLKFPQCKGCLSGKKNSVCNKGQALVESNEYNSCFNRFLLSTVKKEGFVDAFGAVVEIVKRLAGTQDVRETLPYVYCAGLHAIERSLEAKGRLYNWSYNEVDLLVNGFTNVIRSLCQALLPDTSKGANLSLQDPTEEFSKEYLRLCSGRKGPFTGCEYCKELCLYRYEVNELIGTYARHRNWDSVGDEEIEELSGLILRDTACIAPLSEGEAHYNISSCYLAQVIASSNVLFWRQEVLFKRLHEVLRTAQGTFRCREVLQ
jgi:hypothetical protein